MTRRNPADSPSSIRRPRGEVRGDRLGRLGEPADVADVVAFLCGPDGRWMTGQNLRATGGLC